MEVQTKDEALGPERGRRWIQGVIMEERKVWEESRVPSQLLALPRD